MSSRRLTFEEVRQMERMFYVEHRSMRQIARILGVSQTCVYKRINHPEAFTDMKRIADVVKGTKCPHERAG